MSFVFQDFCLNCGKDLIRPRIINRPHQKKRLEVFYECGSRIEWMDFDKKSRSWSVSVSFQCPYQSDFFYDSDNEPS